ncbi:MAG: hypothetical protein IJ770_03230 [Alphaproteobacteria bacterium]|nr:hypothetical protein [Alphaproteobacteria bacterium]
MADMTNEEFKQKAEDAASNAQSATDFLSNVSQSNIDDYDADSLAKIEELLNISGANLPKSQRDAVLSKIAAQKEKLAQRSELDSAQQEQPAQEEPSREVSEDKTSQEKTEQEKVSEEQPKPQQPQQESPSQEQPQPEQEQPNSKFDGMTSYDLFMKRENLAREIEGLAAQENPNLEEINKRQAEIKEIEKYAQKELAETNLDEDNAPMVKDYVEILTRGIEGYQYEHADELEQKLADYDKTNGLDGELPSAEQVKANEDKWSDLTSGAKYSVPSELGKDAGIRALAKEEPKILKETLEILRTAALTQLSIEAPDEDQQKALARYHEKLEELSAQFLGNVNTSIRQVMASEEERNKWLKQYLTENKLSEEDWKNIQQDPEKKKEHAAQFTKYVVTNIYKATNCAYTEKNAMYASRLARKTNMSQTPARAAEQKKEMTGKHPKLMAAVKEGAKNIAWTAGLAVALGPIGVTARQGWKLAGAFKKSYNTYKEQNDGKGSIGGFFKYLNNNREEAMNLMRQTALFATSAVFTGAMAASGTLAFGALGSLAGIGAQAAGQAAVQTTVMGLAKYKVTGVITAASGLGQYFHANHEASAAKKDLTALLQKYMPEQEAPAKGIFGKLFNKSPAKQAVSNLTGLIRNGDEKVMAKLEAMAPNMSAEDRETAMNLINRIKASKGKAVAAGLSTAVGGIFMTDTAQNFIAEQTQNLKSMLGFGSNAASGNGGNNGNGGKPWDPNKSFTENMEDRQWGPNDITKQPDIKVPYAPGMQPVDGAELTEGGAAVTLPADSFNKGGDMWYATQMGPTALEEKLRAMGLDDAMNKLPRASHGAIPSRVMADYLKTANFSSEQAKELQDFVGNRQSFDAECARINLRDGYTPHGNGGASHLNQGNGGNGGNNTVPTAPIQKAELPSAKGVNILQDPTKKPVELHMPETTNASGSAKQSGVFSFLHKKQDYNVTIPRTGNLNADVENYAYQVALQRELQKAGVTDLQNPTQAQLAAAKAVIDQKGYHITGKMTDAAGVEHKFKVVRHRDGTVNRTVDGAKMSMKTPLTASEDAVQYATYRRVKLSPTAVVDPNAGEDFVSQKADKLRGILKTKENGVATTYTAITDGDTGKDFIVKAQNGQSVAREVKNASYSLKQLAKGAQQSR